VRKAEHVPEKRNCVPSRRINDRAKVNNRGNFRNGNVKIICCTPTLAYGVDFPAYRSIIKDLKRFTSHGLSWIPVLDTCRFPKGGRPNYDNEGEAIAIALTGSEKEKYLKICERGP